IAQPVDLIVNFSGDLSGQLGNRLDLLSASGQETVGGAEMAHQGPLSYRTDPAQLVQERTCGGSRAPAAMVGYRESVGLITHSLQQSRGVAVTRNAGRALHAGEKDLLFAL